MKKSVFVLGLLLTSTGGYASSLSESNPVLRNLTLNESEWSIGAGISYGSANGEDDVQPILTMAYGINDRLTVGPVGLRYSVIPRVENSFGFELTADAGLMGLYESSQFGDSYAYGGGLSGKYVFSETFALNLSGHYFIWNEDKREDRKELRAQVSALLGVTANTTAYIGAAYRELKDFDQDNAYELSAGLIWNFSKQLDVMFDATYTDFDAQLNGYANDSHLERALSMSFEYRF